MTTMLWLGSAAVAAGLGAAAVGLGRAVQADGGSREALAILSADGGDRDRTEFSRPFAVRLLGPAWQTMERAVRMVTPSWWLDRLRRNASYAGLGSWGLDGLLAVKVLLAIAGLTVLPLTVALAGAPFGRVALWAVAGAALGFFAPDVWLARLADARQREIRRVLPEAMDLMAISVTAGVGLEASIALVAQRLDGALGEELTRMLHEIQLGSSRREALHALRDRTDIPELGTFALALAQADQLGSPLADVLRVQAGEMRMLRRQRAREAAAKTPVKLLMPLLFGIFPALMIVILGPAVIQISKMFG